MSRESSAVERARHGVTRLLGQTSQALRGALERTDGKLVFGAVTVTYLAVYLWGLNYLGPNAGGTTVVLVDDPLTRATERIAPYQYEPVALVAAGPVELLFSPVNTLLGLVLGALVGANLALSWVAYRGPEACGLSPGAGTVAGVPALLSGFACCGPTILLVVGVQASAGILAAFQWLVPISAVALVATLFWVGSRVEETQPQ
jgi:hypothetical protein